MKEVNKEILKEAIENLTETDPDPKLWNRIESFLDFDLKLAEAKNGLETFEPEYALWNLIQDKLNKKNKKIFHIPNLIKYSLATAATILIAFLVWQHLKPLHNDIAVISYSIENKKLADSLPTPAKAEQDSENFIRISCSMSPGRCENPEISSLKKELENLDNQYKRLKEAALRYGTDENIVQATIKIENTKSKIIHELVLKLKS
jgi:hypothetical protein